MILPQRNCQSEVSSMKDAVVILGGAFNPVHTQHVEMLCRAKQELEINGQWNIIGGYLAVATDSYVCHKLRSRNERTIKLKHRLELVREAMKGIAWLENSPFQNEMLKQHDGSAFSLGQRLKRFLKPDNFQILILIGGDRVVKRNIPIWRSLRSNESSIIRVGIQRKTDNTINLFEIWQNDLDKNLIPNPNDFILLNLDLQPVSSSLVRTYLNRWFSAKDDSQQKIKIENELVNTNSFLHASVMNYIKTHQDDLYLEE